jgi:hypothetical protein
MPDEHPICIRIEGEQPPITVGAVVNLSGPNDHASAPCSISKIIIGIWLQRDSATGSPVRCAITRKSLPSASRRVTFPHIAAGHDRGADTGGGWTEVGENQFTDLAR